MLTAQRLQAPGVGAGPWGLGLDAMILGFLKVEFQVSFFTPLFYLHQEAL